MYDEARRICGSDKKLLQFVDESQIQKLCEMKDVRGLVDRGQIEKVQS